MTQIKQNLWFILLFVIALTLVSFVSFAHAQQGGGSGGSSSGAGDQQQDRDRLQDGTGDNCTTTDCDGVPDQDRLQDRDQDRLKDGTGDGVPDQDRDRDQDRIHVDSATALDEYVKTQQETRTRTEAGDNDEDEGMTVESRVRARVAADAVMAAEPLLGGNGPRMSQVATEVNRAFQNLEGSETALQNRSRLRLFLFGQDDEVVTVMQQEMEQNQNRIEEMKQLMQTCGDECDAQVVQKIVVQIQNMEREQNRLQEVIDEADSRVGLFGFLFGWLR